MTPVYYKFFSSCKLFLCDYMKGLHCDNRLTQRYLLWYATDASNDINLALSLFQIIKCIGLTDFMLRGCIFNIMFIITPEDASEH